MIYFSATKRSTQPELMDDFMLQGTEMKRLLTDLQIVNKWLGGNQITLEGIETLLSNIPKTQTITILDVGCGDGEMLRQCARFAASEGYQFQLIGVDANAFILEEAKQRSKDFQNISYQQLDVFSEALSEVTFDICLCTLFLHHFSNSEIEVLVNRLQSKATLGTVVNDLQRNRLAFWLFSVFSHIFLKTKIARYDGLVSVASGFRKKELVQRSEAIKNSTSTIRWKWAFRYQWILKKNT
ncbi:methyltransferase domain-containing protein [Ulvibacter litoralis]|uniref:Methyltransferase domain-containing protein n=1 Tax=Ulvibacter litoralis TaxID=227084 RepID=A0A1G7FNR6_9FLAO|nr:methyltransferase domain-containing protein [Ulvibacter litoralis]GHC50399.1 hypothetical protein GCM10008083_12380 [Ulvibacter litoralis]SDE77506.1 hypothetical protein SAMN05421855_102672 [Ulvibacter litoralis]